MTEPSGTPRTDAVAERLDYSAVNDECRCTSCTFRNHARDLERELADAINRLSDSPTWIAVEGYDPERPKDGEKVLGWWAPVAATGYPGGMESLTFGAADEEGRSDTWRTAFGESADTPDYWTRIRGPK